MSSEIKVLTDEQIKQKLAGYKSNYTKRINAAKTTKERKALEEGRDAFIAERLHEIMKENRHQIMRRAGVRSWESRRANSKKDTVDKKETTKVQKPATPAPSRKNRGSKVGIRIINK